MLKINFLPFPTLLTERLILRQIQDTDDNEIFKLRADERLMQFIDRPRATNIEDARILIRRMNDDLVNNNGITWAITLKTDPALIGTIGFWRIVHEHFRAEIGYMLDYEQQRKGLMQEALEKVLDYGFNTMNLHTVEANVKPENEASIKLIERNGFVREGYFRENFYYDGKFLDSAIYSLLNTGSAGGNSAKK